jgi:hypothetical protein
MNKIHLHHIETVLLININTYTQVFSLRFRFI